MAKQGKYVYEWPRPMVTADTIIINIGAEPAKILLINRGKEPFKGKWALPGGFIELDEELETAAARELQEETGLTGIELEQMYTFGGIGRDPRGRMLTVTFIGFVESEPPVKAGDDAQKAKWFDITDMPKDMAFDHNLITGKAKEKIRIKKLLKISDFLKIDGLNWGYRFSRVLQIANRTGVFDALSNGPLTNDLVSRKCNTKPEFTEKLLIACASLRLVIKKGDKYENSKLADKFLVKGAKLYQGNMIAHSTWVRKMWDEIEKNIAIEPQEDNQQQQHYNFIMAMDNIFKGCRGDFFLESIDLRDKRKLLDIGGGPGSYSIAACKKYPELEAVVFDLKETIEIAKTNISDEGMSEKIHTIAGDWETDTLGSGFDAAIMSNVLHGKTANALMKLKKAYDALEPEGLLAVQEFLLDDNKDGPLTAALFNLMVGAYSQKELIEVVTQAGFINAKVVSAKEIIGSGWLTAQKPSL